MMGDHVRHRPDMDLANIHFFRNMNPDDFLRLLVHSKGIIGNSSVAIRECSYLGVPAVNIGSRQQGRERGANVIDVEHDRREIVSAARRHLSGDRPKRDTLYGNGDAGQRIDVCGLDGDGMRQHRHRKREYDLHGDIQSLQYYFLLAYG